MMMLRNLDVNIAIVCLHIFSTCASMIEPRHTASLSLARFWRTSDNRLSVAVRIVTGYLPFWPAAEHALSKSKLNPLALCRHLQSQPHKLVFL